MDRKKRFFIPEPWRDGFLWLILFLFLILGSWGIHYGLPEHYIGDEESLIGGALRMLQNRHFIPALHPKEFAFFYYPPGLAYILILVWLPVIGFFWLHFGFDWTALQNYFALDQTVLWLVARGMAVLAGAVTLAVVYRISRELYPEKTLHVYLSYF